MTDSRKEQAKSLISFYNFTAGTRYKFIDSTLEAAENALTSANDNINEVKAWIRENATKYGVTECFKIFCDKKTSENAQTVVRQASPVDGAMGILENVVVELIAKMKLSEIENTVAEHLHEEIKEFIANEYGPIERKIKLEMPERKVEMKGVMHEKFETVLKFVSANEPVFLTGPAGTGKNFLCKQIAEALGLNFYFSNAVTQEYKITGFTDANGTFHESQFYKAFKDGGLFMLDEMDASIPEVLIILNAAIANRYFDFPAPIGYVEAHPNFRVVAAGNTFGNGADYEYVGRNQLDAASLDRFALVSIDYDKRIEENQANGNTDLVNFCRAFRHATREAGINTVVSYRAIGRMAKLDSMLETSELIKTCLTKSLCKDDLNILKTSLKGFGKYSEAFEKVANEVM